MAFFSLEQIKAALDYWEGQGHTLLYSVLAMLEKGVPTSDDPADTVTFGARNENELLKKYFAPKGAAEDYPFYSPFMNTGTSRWRDRQYAGRSLQPIRTHNPDIFYKDKATKKWALTPGYPAAVRGKIAEKGDVPVSLPALTVWCLRTENVENLNTAVARLVAELNLNRDGLVEGDSGGNPSTTAIFDMAIPDGLDPLAMSDVAIDPADLLKMLNERTDPPGRLALKSSDEDSGETSLDVVQGMVSPNLVEGGWDLTKADLIDLGPLRGLYEPAFRAAAALRAGLHVIFTGPPGTGKTTLAAALCEKAGNAYWTVPATDQWTTFETIGGYFPKPDVEGRDALDFLPGAVVDSIERKRCLIIDELNRADIDKAFGELFTLLTGNAVTLPFMRRSPEGFRRVRLETKAVVAEADIDVIGVPSWWRIIGAMNNVDKASLKRMSVAFNRRFVFVPIDLPAPEIYKQILDVEAARMGSLGGGDMGGFLARVVDLFAHKNSGFGGMGLPMGPGIPLVMLSQAHSEWTMDPSRSLATVMQSALEGLVASQLDGRSDRSSEILNLLAPHVEDVAELTRVFGIWTGVIA